MIEILILLAVSTLLMAKKQPARRRQFQLRRVRVTAEQPLATLGSDTALATAMVVVAISSYRAMSLVATWALVNFTAGEGPITVGLAYGDYTVAEIKEAFEASGSVDFGDKIAQERANRQIRVVGTLGGQANSELNDGKPIKTKLNWLIPVGETINIYAFNESTGALTTGSRMTVTGNLWVKPSA